MRSSLLSSRSGALLALGLLAAPAVAAAAQLIVNGVPIGKVELTVQGLEGITFEKCNFVKIEATSDVKVECPGYDLQAAVPMASQEQKTSIPGKITKRYWVAMEQSEKGITQYDVDLYVNAKWVKRFKGDDDGAAFELTKYLVPGKNKLLFASTKNLAAGRRSISPAAFFRVVVGEGDIGGNQVMIDNPLVEVRRTAAETENVTEEREILAR